MRFIPFFIIFLFNTTIYAQNLVPNPSFEKTNTSFCGIITSGSSFSSTAQNWNAVGGTPDLYYTNISTSCYNYQPSSSSTYPGPIGFTGNELPRTGNVMAGIIVYTIPSFNQREYIQVQFTQPLVVGKSYIVEFYISHADYKEKFSEKLGVFLSTTSVSSSGSVIAQIPQIEASKNQLNQSTGWTKISETIIATSPYQFLTIGNFYDDTNTPTSLNPNSSGAPGAYGAYYYIDDVSVREKVEPLVITNSTITPVNCTGSVLGSIDLTISGGASPYSYNWSNGSTSEDLSGLGAGRYYVTVSDNSALYLQDSFDIVTPTLPTINAYLNNLGQKRDTISLGNSITLHSTGSAQTVNWTSFNSNATILSPNSQTSLAQTNVSGLHGFLVTANSTTHGITCTSTDTLWVLVENNYIGIPSAFTPNQDGKNDLFRPVGISLSAIIKFRIYNRFGQLVYHGDNLDNSGWDGSVNGVAQPRDTYLYMLEYNNGQATKMIRGEVTLLR